MDKWERKLGWMSFPGLLRYYALFHVMVFLLQFVNPQIGEVLDFDRQKIMEGELWRVFTFLFADSGFKGQGAFAMLFLFFMVMIAFMMSDALEGAWGVFRTSMFHFTAFAGLLAANFIYANPMPGSGFFVYSSAFFAFATLFPRHEFLMFLIIPVQVRWLAALWGGLLVVGALGQPLYLGYLLLAFANYILWAGIPALRGQARVLKAAGRKGKFTKAAGGDDEAFHRCAKCDRTEISDPDLDFRMSADGREYCEDHLAD
ncbi:hypothetical protein HZ994_11260 [Akkermansiaceae bacterium]|nr:hypothetical protein HZ994_11260 [Akkermansiaceae bacterium]